jgi:hypothetical protein
MAEIEGDPARERKARLNLSLDGWAVVLALIVCVLIRFGLIKSIPW